jgi:hypothetical protein
MPRHPRFFRVWRGILCVPVGRTDFGLAPFHKRPVEALDRIAGDHVLLNRESEQPCHPGASGELISEVVPFARTVLRLC